MPKQRVFFGRLMPRLAARRISVLLAGTAIFALFTLFFTLPSAVPTGPSLSEFTDHKVSIPSIPRLKSGLTSSVFNPFRQPSHPPARQDNDTYGESSWYANWKWMAIPFSSSITLDEDRSLLPPVKERPPIYCYYDVTIDKDQARKDAESDILLTWRRAWWAQGFKPIILSAAEAMNNPMYEELQRMEMEPSMKTDLMKWLAWENMGGGLLSHYLLLPMDSYEEPLLEYLRRGEYPVLTRWKNLDDGLFAGSKAEVTAATKAALDSPYTFDAQDILTVMTKLDPDPFAIDDQPSSLAFYNAKNLETHYIKVANLIGTDRATGLQSLNQLINSHLHGTWQSLFSDGIAVLKPLAHHTTHLVQPAVDLAYQLSACADTPAPSSCPPNRPKCSPCVSSPPMRVMTPGKYRNSSTLYTIGTVPHPYTMLSLHNLREHIGVPWLRRESARDGWLTAATMEVLGTGVGVGPRVLRFKEAVAGEYAIAHSLWISAEEDIPDDLDWYLGFALPREGGFEMGKSETPVPGPEQRPKPMHDPADGPVANPEELQLEPNLIEKAKQMGKSKSYADRELRTAVEAWNLGDTEAWKFARAFLARERVERLKWEEQEAKYVGGAGSDKGRRQSSGWTRWLDSDDGDA